MSAARGPGPAPPRLAAHWWTGQRTLLGTTASLLATTVITTALGLAFWWAAARLIPLNEVGYGSAAVSGLTLVGTLGMAGMNTVLIGYLAHSPRYADGLLTAAMYASALISALLACGFWLIAAVVAPNAAPYLHNGTEAVIFIAGSALTGAALILDEAVLGVIGGSPQLWRNATFAVAKLAALAGLVTLWHDRFGTSVLTAWVAGMALSLVPVGVLLRRRGMRLTARPEWRLLRGLGRDTIANTWLNNMLQVPVLAMPMLVTGMLSAAAGAGFYVAWTVVMVAVLLPFHFTTALYAASAADPRGLAAKLRFSLRISMLGGLVGVPLVIVCAHWLLRLFGARYADLAAVPLELLIMSYFGSVLKNHYIALCRISGRITRAGIYATVSAAARLGAAVAGAMIHGLDGLSIALLIVMTVEGIVVIPPVRAALNGRTPRPASGQGPSRARSAKGLPMPVRHPPLATAARSEGQRPRVCYYLQTHRAPEQVARLVALIKEGSPASVVLISHDAAAPPLDTRRLEALPGVHVFTEPGGYGDFSHLDRYFAAIDWLDAHGIDYDWLENITGQDYPLRPIADIERDLAGSGADGYLLYAPVFPDRTPPAADRGAAPGFALCAPGDATMRYLYRHRRFGRPTAAKQRWLRPLMGINLLQPWVRVSLAFSSVGLRRRKTVFGDDFVCYGGWFFCTLSAACARYVRDFAHDNPDLIAFFRTLLAPEEVFLQTVLVNSGKFRFEPDAKRYIDLNGSRNNHSNTLGIADLDAMLASGANWARKFDGAHDAGVLDALDRVVRAPTGKGLPYQAPGDHDPSRHGARW